MTPDFPDFEKWCEDVLNPDDTNPWDFRTREWYEYYHNKHRIARAFKPHSVLEVGVRYGYSAHAFCSTFELRGRQYSGIDSNESSLGWACGMLLRTLPFHDLQILPLVAQSSATDCERMKRFCPSGFDFIHIDADHSHEGCLADMNKFSPLCNRAMLVDDYDQCDGVRQAVDEFSRKSGWLKFYMPSIRGEALLLR